MDILMYGEKKVVDLDAPYTVYDAELIPVKEAKRIYTAPKEAIQNTIDLLQIDGRLSASNLLIEYMFAQMNTQTPGFCNPELSLSKKLETMTNINSEKYWIKRSNQ